ncbi:hypothetical protein C8F04DRAFT_386002 [Mycena alexandri]|uniref:F-box domain-containing protein n=1 Tax=Mycena alexandri TaxID=1745969 RepID=A0AAD6T252_9AGAR|nr:hypothetical protein C8F04DRAFT_386002 [Mycena alexandri]
MLLDLPNEILIIVCHLGDPSPIYLLSTMCRRLHFLALPIYLSRIGVCHDVDSAEGCNISIGPENSDALAVLLTSLLLNVAQSLSCALSTLKDVARFTRLCSRLSRIEAAELRFSPPSHDYADESQAAYYTEVVKTLNVVLEKACESLTVDIVLGASAPTISRISRRSRLQARAPKRGRIPGLLTTSISLSPAAFRQRTLSTFRLHSDIVFSPHCLAWTIDVLNSFPLAVISIDAPTVQTDVLDALLSVTEIPTLCDMSILNCRLRPSQMHLFLSRHPSITRLHLGNVIVPPMQERLPPDHLPQLTALSAAAAQVAYLLHTLDQTGALREIRVLSHMTQLDLIFTDASLRPVASRLAPVSLSLVLPVLSNLPRLPTSLGGLFGDDSALKLVTTLEFVFGDDNIAFNTLADYVSLTPWCAPFPGLRNVELVGFNSTYSIELARQAFKEHAPTIEMLVIGGVEYR